MKAEYYYIEDYSDCPDEVARFSPNCLSIAKIAFNEMNKNNNKLSLWACLTNGLECRIQ